MTAAGTQRIMNVIKKLPDEFEDQIMNFILPLQTTDAPNKKPLNRTPGTFADKITYIAPDFDSCIEDNPTALGLEAYI